MQTALTARHRLRLTWATLALCGALFSVHCGDPGDVTEVSPATESDTTGPPRELVSPDAWLQLSDDDDPFAALRAQWASKGLEVQGVANRWANRLAINYARMTLFVAIGSLVPLSPWVYGASQTRSRLDV